MEYLCDVTGQKRWISILTKAVVLYQCIYIAELLFLNIMKIYNLLSIVDILTHPQSH